MNRFRRAAAAPGPRQRAAGCLLALGWLSNLNESAHPAVEPLLEGTRRPRGPAETGPPIAARIAPVVLRHTDDIEGALQAAAETASAGPERDVARYSGGMLLGLLHGVALKTALAPGFEPARGLWRRLPLSDEVQAASLSLDESDARTWGPAPSALLRARLRLQRRHDFPRQQLPMWLEADGLETAALIALLAGAAFGATAVPGFDESVQEALQALATES